MGDLASLGIRSWEVLTTSLTGAALRMMRSGIPTVVGRSSDQGPRAERTHYPYHRGAFLRRANATATTGQAMTDPLRSGGQA